jgi:hypothetical protein
MACQWGLYRAMGVLSPQARVLPLGNGVSATGNQGQYPTGRSTENSKASYDPKNREDRLKRHQPHGRYFPQTHSRRKSARSNSSRCAMVRTRILMLGLGLGLVCPALSGCQTHVGGMTLPSAAYLEHPPQYIPPSPPFAHTRELAQQEEIASRPAPGAVPGR